MRTLAILAVLVLGGGGAIGCASRDKVTEEDRVVVHYNAEAWALAAQLQAAIAADPMASAAALATVVQKYGLPLSASMKKSWGDPEKPPAPISEDAVKAAVDGAGKSHALPWWQTALAGALSAAGIMLTLGKTVARFIPGVGQYVTLAESAFAGVERYMQDRKAAGDVAAVERLATFLQSEQSDPRLRQLVESTLHRVKVKLGVDGTENLAVPAAPLPTPAPSTAT